LHAGDIDHPDLKVGEDEEAQIANHDWWIGRQSKNGGPGT
jgi:hypothetical protein